MAYVPSATTVTLEGYLTQTGRALYYSGADNDIQPAYFTLGDSDVNYLVASNAQQGTDIPNTPRNGFIPRLTGDLENCITHIAQGVQIKYSMDSGFYPVGAVVSSYCQYPHTLVQQISQGYQNNKLKTTTVLTENSPSCGYLFYGTASIVLTASTVANICTAFGPGGTPRYGTPSFSATSVVNTTLYSSTLLPSSIQQTFKASDQQTANALALSYLVTNITTITDSLVICLYGNVLQTGVYPLNTICNGLPYFTAFTASVAANTYYATDPTTADNLAYNQVNSILNAERAAFVCPLFPPAGTVLSQACQGPNLVDYIADGLGGQTVQVVAVNSPTCVQNTPLFGIAFDANPSPIGSISYGGNMFPDYLSRKFVLYVKNYANLPSGSILNVTINEQLYVFRFPTAVNPTDYVSGVYTPSKSVNRIRNTNSTSLYNSNILSSLLSNGFLPAAYYATKGFNITSNTNYYSKSVSPSINITTNITQNGAILLQDTHIGYVATKATNKISGQLTSIGYYIDQFELDFTISYSLVNGTTNNIISQGTGVYPMLYDNDIYNSLTNSIILGNQQSTIGAVNGLGIDYFSVYTSFTTPMFITGLKLINFGSTVNNWMFDPANPVYNNSSYNGLNTVPLPSTI